MALGSHCFHKQMALLCVFFRKGWFEPCAADSCEQVAVTSQTFLVPLMSPALWQCSTVVANEKVGCTVSCHSHTRASHMCL